MSIWFDESALVEDEVMENRPDVTRGDGSPGPTDMGLRRTVPGVPPDAAELAEVEKAVELLRGMTEQMVRMAAAMEETRQRMAELEQAVRTLEKVTPAQGAEINRRIRTRAAEICGDWGLRGSQKLVAGWIRRAVRDRTGVKTAREVPRCDYQAVCGMVDAWEDVALIRKARDTERVKG